MGVCQSETENEMKKFAIVLLSGAMLFQVGGCVSGAAALGNVVLGLQTTASLIQSIASAFGA